MTETLSWIGRKRVGAVELAGEDANPRQRFHQMVFGVRVFLWIITAVFIGIPAWREALAVGVVILALLGGFTWRSPRFLMAINQVMIAVEWLLLAWAIARTGGLSSSLYILYGAEALYLTAYGRREHALAGAVAMVLVYGWATHGWHTAQFWWRSLVMALYFVAAGFLGHQFRLMRHRSVEMTRRMEQLGQIKLLQQSLLHDDQSLDAMSRQLLKVASDIVRMDAAILVQADSTGRVVHAVAHGLDSLSDDLWDGLTLPSALTVVADLVHRPELQANLYEALRKIELRTLVLIPLKIENVIKGHLILATRPRRMQWAEEEFAIRSVADVLLTQLRFTEAQQVANKRGRLLGILERVGRIVNRNLDMLQLMRGLREAVAKELELDSFLVALTIPEDPEHVLLQYLWDDGEEYPAEVFPLQGEGLAAQVILSGQSLLLNGPQDGGILTGSRKRPIGMIFAPLEYEGRVLGALSVQSYRIEYDHDYLEFVSAIASQATIAIRNAQMYQQTQQAALTDYLTGLGNSRQFNLALQAHLETARETGHGLSLLIIDSDSLKTINDRYGHQAGDAHLKMVAETIRGSIREVDVACRYAGDEFVVILPRLSLSEAVAVGERIRSEIADRHWEFHHHPVVGATISVGAASLLPSMTAEDLFQTADRALYQAKQLGKNRVVAVS